MRLVLDRAVEVRCRHELAQIGIALVILGQQSEPVDDRAGADVPRSSNTEHRPDDRLNTFGDAGVAEGHRPIETIAVGESERWETKLCSLGRDGLRFHRPFEHGEGREDSKWNVGLSHILTMGLPDGLEKSELRTYPQQRQRERQWPSMMSQISRIRPT